MATRISDQWEDYRRDVIAPNAGAVQIQECRRAFYAGAFAVLCQVRLIGADDTITEEASIAILETLTVDVEAFCQAVGTDAEGAKVGRA